MNASRTSKIRGSNYLAGTLAALLLAVCTVQADNKPKASAPAPRPRPLSRLQRRARSQEAAARRRTARPPGGPAAAHGPTTTTGAAHGAESRPRATARRDHDDRRHGATTTTTAATARQRPVRRAPDQRQPLVEQPPDRPQRPLGEQAPRYISASAAPWRLRAPRRAACLTRPAAPRPKAARCAVLRRATRSECAPVENPATCMSPVATWTSIMDWPAAGAARVERADHSRIVAERGGRGYVQHPYMYHGHEYGHRTYYEHGRAYDRFYARYPYHGVYVEMYSPGVLLSAGLLRMGVQSVGRADRVSSRRLGLGRRLLGMDSMALTSRRTRCIRAHRCG